MKIILEILWISSGFLFGWAMTEVYDRTKSGWLCAVVTLAALVSVCVAMAKLMMR